MGGVVQKAQLQAEPVDRICKICHAVCINRVIKSVLFVVWLLSV